MITVSSLLAMSLACRPAPPANPAFDEAAAFALTSFDDEDPINLAFAARAIEAQVLDDIDLDGGLLDRSRTPQVMSEQTAASFPEVPERDPGLCLPVSVAHLSAWSIEDHVAVQQLADQRPIEPASADKYDRIILEGAECWASRECELLRTENPLIKDNVSMTLDYTLWKDLRWVDLGLPDPADVPEGEIAETNGERWALVGRSWISESAQATEGGASIMQSYSIEVWLPQDGQQTLRMMALWSETQFEDDDGPDDDSVAGITRYGIQGIFDAADDWIEDKE
ncbi:MAG: hypothetical protein ACI9VR_000282 [Cognaticolwellia sp.]|jgi:hypothetical protein